MLFGVISPDIHSLCKEKCVVQVGDGAVHRIAISHFDHGGPRLTLHEFDLWKITERRTEVTRLTLETSKEDLVKWFGLKWWLVHVERLSKYFPALEPSVLTLLAMQEEKLPVPFPSRSHTSVLTYWPALRCHTDRRCWRHGLRSSSWDPIHTPWWQETQRGRRTRQEEGEGVRNLARSFFHHALSLVDPCGDFHRVGIHSSHHSCGNHLLKKPAVSKRRE